MNIPFDNIYHYIEGRLDRPSVFYLFLPNGSRQIMDLKPLRCYPESQLPLLPRVICHDQEPLCWKQYTHDQVQMQEHHRYLDQCFKSWTNVPDWLQSTDLNLDQATCVFGGVSIFDQPVLLHSELNSPELRRYQQAGYIPAFWLCHAMIARDWYRFANNDHRLHQRTNQPLQHPFLIYSRGFTGSRQYRLRFLEQLCSLDLVRHSAVSCLHQENGTALRDFSATDSQWQMRDPELLTSLPECQVPSSASAAYDTHDITSTACQIVLETKYDGACLHLTEKTFRPLATAQPFMLMAAPGALALLRHYGFETFHGLIDESYDQIQDSQQRMTAVLAEMTRLSGMSQTQWHQWRARAQAVAYRNQERFFSDAFADMVWDECLDNLAQALDQSFATRGKNWLAHRRYLRSLGEHGRAYLRRSNEINKLRQLRVLRQGL
jgi:hypothetical protein